MAMNSETPKQGGGGAGELERRVASVEARLTVIEKTMVTAEAFERELGGVRGEIGALRDEMHVGLAGLREEVRAGQANLREEMQAGHAGLREEMRAEQANLREEMHAGHASLRADMHDGQSSLRQELRDELGKLRQDMRHELGAVRVDIAKIPFELVKWLIAVSGIAAAVATGVYNLFFR
jgi:hypothetical protein